jgi:arabinofuranosyltransferase
MTRLDHLQSDTYKFTSPHWQKIALVMILCTFLFELIRTAWISDDAGITLRTIINFLHGYGPRFNVDERVQGYTHPLWFLLLSGVSYVFGNVYYATFFSSIALSILALWIVVFKIPIKFSSGLLAGLALILSKAYLDFSTSGLENPLSHLLIATIALVAFNLATNFQAKNLKFFYIACALLYLTRADLILIVAPLAIYILGYGRLDSTRALDERVKKNKLLKVQLSALFIGALPLLIWIFFSVFYYGFLFPNTAYAKLATGISFEDRILQGQAYFAHFAQTDPLSCLVILIGVVLGLCQRNYLAVTISIGILLYLGFILSIGGDFMGGRFFTAPLLLATIQIARFPLTNLYAVMLATLIVIFGAYNINETILSGTDYSDTYIDSRGIANERGQYFPRLGLLTGQRDGIFSMRDWSMDKKEVRVVCGGLGFMSLRSGPSTHFIDTCALTDPLLSRLPSFSSKQRVGHFGRALPAGYLESITQGENLIEDNKTRDMYNSIRAITRGELDNITRLRHIISMNLIGLKKEVVLEQPKYRDKLAIDFSMGEIMYFKESGKGSLFLRSESSKGWGRSEEWGTWAVGSKARFSLPIPSASAQTLYLDVQVLISPMINSQTVNVYKVVSGSVMQGFFRLHNWRTELVTSLEIAQLDNNILRSARIAIPIDKKMIGEGSINLEFRFPTPVRPKDINLNSDDRELSMGLISAIFR